jgi:hypothetical protein
MVGQRLQENTCYCVASRYSFPYLFVCSEATFRSQLVGTALFVIVKSELTSVIRNVEGATRKVGQTVCARTVC